MWRVHFIARRLHTKVKQKESRSKFRYLMLSMRHRCHTSIENMCKIFRFRSANKFAMMFLSIVCHHKSTSLNHRFWLTSIYRVTSREKKNENYRSTGEQRKMKSNEIPFLSDKIRQNVNSLSNVRTTTEIAKATRTRKGVLLRWKIRIPRTQSEIELTPLYVCRCHAILLITNTQ